jgi:hypothetical protein
MRCMLRTLVVEYGLAIFSGRLENNLKTEVISKLAADQSLILSGPGTVKISAAKSVTISKAGASQFGSSIGIAKLGASLPALGPFFGFALLSVGALFVVRQWIKKVDNGECQ